MNQIGKDPKKFCEGKIRLNHKEKKKALKKLRSHGITNIAYYKCSHCGWWHLGGHKPKGQLRGDSAKRDGTADTPSNDTDRHSLVVHRSVVERVGENIGPDRQEARDQETERLVGTEEETG